MYSIERQSEILRMMENIGRVEVNDLAQVFHSSRETIRRDLREMEEKGLIKRTHGGAVMEDLLTVSSPEFPVNIREIQRFKEKDAICRTAASFIQNGDILFVDNSSTCLPLIRHIPADIQVTLITNSIKLLLGAVETDMPHMMLVSLGGLFHAANLSTYGTIAQNTAAGFYPTKSFMSCAGIHPPDQLTDSSILEVDTKRLMIERSREVFILADHTKFDRSGPVFLANFSSVQHLIVDNQTTQEQASLLEKSSVKVTWAE
jgi:DeoR family fructose operon transcriptional repressor